MAPGVKPEVRIFPDANTLFQAAAAGVAELIAGSTAQGRDVTVALAGGNTPRGLYETLAADFRQRIPWNRLQVFWSDERYVPPDDSRGNYRMALETLLDLVPIPPHNIHPMPTHFADADQAARAYENTLRAQFAGAWPRFDLILLGLGADGHTASLFPGTPALQEHRRWLVAVRAPAEPPQRLTLTLPVLNHAAHVYFLVTGADKAVAVREALGAAEQARSFDAPRFPSAAVRPMNGTVVWWLDAAAAAQVEV